MNKLLSEAEALFEYTQTLRRDFHAHPELGFKETRTAGIVAKELSNLGLEVHPGVAETGVVAILKGEKPGPTILARFDMDALPIQEETGASYESQTPGTMHACGHDGHTAIGLTVAKILNSHRKELAGKVKFVFQPAEEGLGGAKKMVDEGVLENPKVDYCLALHIWNDEPYGWLGVPDGPALAGAEIFKITVRGKGGHGAAPHLSHDPVYAASQIVVALQSIVSRNIEPRNSGVVSICTIHGGEAFNVIPQEVEMTGTIRYFQPATREKILERFEVIVYGMAETLGCQAEVDIRRVAPAVINHAEIAGRVEKVARKVLPDAHIDTGNNVTMGSEDMAFIMEKVPGCFFFIGSSNSKEGLDAGHHHPRFDFDERALPRGAALMSAAIMDLLEYKK